MLYQDACVSSAIANVPSDAEHFSSCELTLSVAEPAADPVATVFACSEPICMFEQPTSAVPATASTDHFFSTRTIY